MGALCEIQINHQNVWIDIKKSRTDLQVYIDDIEQNATQSSCKLLVFLFDRAGKFLIFQDSRFNFESFRSSLVSFLQFYS